MYLYRGRKRERKMKILNRKYLAKHGPMSANACCSIHNLKWLDRFRMQKTQSFIYSLNMLDVFRKTQGPLSSLVRLDAMGTVQRRPLHIEFAQPLRNA